MIIFYTLLSVIIFPPHQFKHTGNIYWNSINFHHNHCYHKNINQTIEIMNILYEFQKFMI